MARAKYKIGHTLETENHFGKVTEVRERANDEGQSEFHYLIGEASDNNEVREDEVQKTYVERKPRVSKPRAVKAKKSGKAEKATA